MVGTETLWLTICQERSIHRVSPSAAYQALSSTSPSEWKSKSRGRRLTAFVLIGLFLLGGTAQFSQTQALSQNDAITAAFNWLTTHQQSDGSYGSFTEPQTAPAANAMWLESHSSSNVVLSYHWLKNRLQNSTTWFWGGGGNLAEADVPGEILYSFDQTNNLQLLNKLSSVVVNLTKFQQSNGGFLGYYDSTSNKQVTSSVDTSMALLGLIGAKGISQASEQIATTYLLSLQNPDGSFNLTSTSSSSGLYSLGPEPISITALAILALRAASFSASNPDVFAALSYLSRSASSNFNGHVYAAALSSLVFAYFGDSADASIADKYILSQQNSDGGFKDIIRSTTGSEALDTGWAALGLQLGGAVCCSGLSGGSGGRLYTL